MIAPTVLELSHREKVHDDDDNDDDTHLGRKLEDSRSSKSRRRRCWNFPRQKAFCRGQKYPSIKHFSTRPLNLSERGLTAACCKLFIALPLSLELGDYL